MSINNENSDEISLLNAVNITSNVRAPGEFKYYYCGENSTEKDKSFLAVSTMWYTLKITDDHELLASCYNNTFTAQVYLNKAEKIYNLFIYKNEIDYRNENFELKNVQIINLPPPKAYLSPEIDFEKVLTRIFICANTYILLNDIDQRVLIIDFYTGKYVTIFEKAGVPNENLYNVIDIFDEGYLFHNEQHVRTYAFISVKHKEKKETIYTYHYIIVQRGNLEIKKFYLHSLDLNLDDSEPCGIKIVKIPSPDRKEQKWYFICCFFTYQTLFQLVTNFETKTLNQILKQYSHLTGDTKQIWTNKVNIEEGKKEYGQATKIFININTNKVCGLILFFEKGFVMSYPFYYTDTPEEVKGKIFIKDKIKIDRYQKSDPKRNCEIYEISDNYIFKQKTICAYNGQNLVMASKDMLYVFERYQRFPYYKYSFYEESLSLFFLFEGVGSIFLLTANKCFKIIYNSRFDIFNSPEITKANNYVYVPNELNYPSFEYIPEEIYANYQKAIFGHVIEPPSISSTSPMRKSKAKLRKEHLEKEKEKEKDKEKQDKEKSEKEEAEGKCVICGRSTQYKCKECHERYYCSFEHYRYDYFTYHFFECQMMSFFRRTDIMTIPNKEQRYITLYNELIKVFSKILNYIFSRIYNPKDYHFFLQFILTMIDIMNKFGFIVNLEEYSSYNLIIQQDQKTEKVLFYMECLFFYFQMNMLKCTFTLKSRLYNLTDCFLKIIKNELVPKLTRKMKTRIVSLKCDKFKKENYYKGNYFEFLKSGLFFDIDAYFKKDVEIVDLVELYIIRHLFSLSLLVKYKIKIESAIEVKETFVDISLMFEDHYKDIKNTKNTILYTYFSICYYLVEIGKIPQTVKLLKRMVSSFSEKTNAELRALSFYNLGLLQYALGDFRIGVHNLETSYKLIVENNLSEKFLLSVLDSLALAYLNQRSLFKAYVLIQMSIKERKKIRMKENELKCIKLNVYLNYIIDLYEYSFITRTRMQIKKRQGNYDEHQLIRFVLGEEDKEMVTSEQNLEQFIKVVHFIFKLSPSVLSDLHTDNPSRPTISTRDDVHHNDRTLSFNMETSSTSTFIAREQAIEREENIEEYDEDIEFKPKLYDSLTRQQQSEFKELKSSFLKRDIILRDSLGAIEPFNINYHPIYSEEFKKIIDKLKSNFLLKEIFYCFQTEKWRDELYNYNTSSCLFGLAKYLKLEKIKNMLAIERSKLFDSMKKEKKEMKEMRNSIFKKKHIQGPPGDTVSEYEGLQRSSSIGTNFPQGYKNEIDYPTFKKKFIDELKTKEKENKEIYSYLNLNEDYLLSLYNNVFKNNPDQEYIFKNPILILNYIFTELGRGEQTDFLQFDHGPTKKLTSASSLIAMSPVSPMKKKGTKGSQFKPEEIKVKDEEEKSAKLSEEEEIPEQNFPEKEEEPQEEKKEENEKLNDSNMTTVTIRRYDYEDERIVECPNVESFCYFFLGNEEVGHEETEEKEEEKEEKEQPPLSKEESQSKPEEPSAKRSIVKGNVPLRSNRSSVINKSFLSKGAFLNLPRSQFDVFKEIHSKNREGYDDGLNMTDVSQITQEKPKKVSRPKFKKARVKSSVAPRNVPKKDAPLFGSQSTISNIKTNKKSPGKSLEKNRNAPYKSINKDMDKIIKNRNKSTVKSQRPNRNASVSSGRDLSSNWNMFSFDKTNLGLDSTLISSNFNASGNSGIRDPELERIFNYNKRLREGKIN